MDDARYQQPEVIEADVGFAGEVATHVVRAKALDCRPHAIRTVMDPAAIRAFAAPPLSVTTRGWRFPAAIADEGALTSPAAARLDVPNKRRNVTTRPATRLAPPRDAVLFKDRLLYLLQPPLETLFGRRVSLSFEPYPYQMEGIAFLMPRHAALLADEMGLGKTMQIILSLRLLFHAGLISRALIVCPKPLVLNWTRELRTWAEDLPFEVINGNYEARRSSWLVSNCPVKLVNYEVITRDEEILADPRVVFDVVVADEAQRIKTKDSKTARAVRSIRRTRSWAMTGTPIENRVDDLVNIFAFVDEGRIPNGTLPRQLSHYTADCIIRRTKEQVAADIPAKVIKDVHLELLPSQREAYELAEQRGTVYLNSMGSQVTVQHVFELVMRLKQICNFDPETGESSKVEQLQAEIAEIAESGRKAIVFSQWVEPLEFLATILADYGIERYHGQVPLRDRHRALERFRSEDDLHVLLMSYGTGSVGLNLQCANYVFLFDRWWNPAVEDQAVNRAHRIGQKDTVFVYRFLVQNTIEDRIAEVLERKRQLFHDLIEQNEPPPAIGLSQEEIFGLFQITKPTRLAS